MNRSAVLPARQVHAWEALSDVFRISDEHDYERMITLIDQLADAVGDDRSHALAGLLDILATLAHAYEETRHRLPAASPIAVITHLMEEHSLSQKDLPEIGSQGVVSEVLRGVRGLNLRQVTALAQRFGVSPAVFIAPARRP
jgi:HTH-type transcriptional regulator/antitoxin HigA